MAMSINSVTLVGRLAREVELRYTPNGTEVCRITLAVDRDVFNDREPQCDFLDVIIWGKRALAFANNVTVGRLIGIPNAELRARSYTDARGVKRRAVEVNANNWKYMDKKPVTLQQASREAQTTSTQQTQRPAPPNRNGKRK